MNGGALRLLGFAVVCVLVAAGTVVAWSGADGADAIGRELRDVAVAAFAQGSWRWLFRATAAAFVVAVGLTLLELATSIRRTPRSPQFAELGESNIREAITEVRRRVGECITGGRQDVVAALNEVLRGAISVSASDIHASPTPEGLKLVYRVQGTLHPVITLDLELAPRFATRVKVLARLDTYVHGKPQDGRLVTSLGEGTIEARVSTLPTETGERIVMRLVRGSRAVPDLESLGFSSPVGDALKELLTRPQGLLFVTGPVGSGKTTTLYASLKHIAETRGSTTSLVTLEDPIELELPFATQTQMHQRSGMTFAKTLRSVLRQDPNVLMVGEIRDRETAEIAMQAGLTGHLFLTTVHAESAAGPFARLIDMEVEPFALASAAVGSLSQRLVRTLCTACRREAEPDDIVVERFAKNGVVVPPGTYYEPVGCEFCEGRGFAGLAPIAELLLVNDKVRQAINERRSSKELHDSAVAAGMPPLLRDGLMRAARGETSLAEVVRVAG